MKIFLNVFLWHIFDWFGIKKLFRSFSESVKQNYDFDHVENQPQFHWLLRQTILLINGSLLPLTGLIYQYIS